MTYLVVAAAARRATRGWAWKPLARVARIRREPNSDSLSELLSVSSERGVNARPEDGGPQLPSESTITTYWRVHPHDLVVNPMWAVYGGLAVSGVHGAVSPAYRVYEPREEIIPRFLHYWMRSDLAIEQYRLLVRGVTTFDRSVTREDFDGMPVPVPPLATQRAIADYLDRETARIDALIAAKKRMLELVDGRAASLRASSILRGVDPIEGRGPIPPGWTVRKLGAMVTLQRGHDLPADSRVDGSVPVVSSGGVSGFHNEAISEPPGVVTGRYGTIGEVYYLDVPHWPLNTTLYVSDFRGQSPRWVWHMLAALPLDFDAEKTAVTGINRNVIGVLRVAVPPLEEQERIADEIDKELDGQAKIADALTKQITLLQERRQALITAAVTGDIDVPAAA